MHLRVCVCDWQEMQMEVGAALAQKDPNLVLSSAFKLRITQRDLGTLQEGSWLNDEVRICICKHPTPCEHVLPMCM